jgi:hypothetical protein
MANCKCVQFQPLPDGGAAFCFDGNTNQQMLADEVAAFFGSQAYKFEGGTPMNAMWGQGSDVLRVLFGAFAKRFKFNVAIEPQAPYVWLRLSKGMSGAMGGVIGYSKMNKELSRVTAAMQQFFA